MPNSDEREVDMHTKTEVPGNQGASEEVFTDVCPLSQIENTEYETQY